jgi:hypothetical protein
MNDRWFFLTPLLINVGIRGSSCFRISLYTRPREQKGCRREPSRTRGAKNKVFGRSRTIDRPNPIRIRSLSEQSPRQVTLTVTEFAVKMASPDPQKTPNDFISGPGTPSDLSNGSSGGLHIPISSDSGFYGYNDEKHLQHVSLSTPTLHRASDGHYRHRWERSSLSNVEHRQTPTVEERRSNRD